jgi:hypothetical protein
LECHRDPVWDEYPERAARKSSEAEECIVGRDVTKLDQYMIDVIWTDGISVIQQPALRHEPLRPMPVSEELMTWSYCRLLAKTKVLSARSQASLPLQATKTSSNHNAIARVISRETRTLL